MRILIVEDEIKLAQALKKILEAEHYVVDVCFDGEEGLEQAMVESYDVIVMDINMPVMDGLEACAKLRENEVMTPVIMLTARDTTGDKITGLDAGADDYVVKPFEFDELLARVRALLRRPGTKTQPILQVSNLTLNPKSRIVQRNNKEVTLSAKEYALLEYMMRHPNQVIGKTKLLDHVWGGEVDPFSNVIDVYVGYLRKKIDKAFPKNPQLIHTIKGMGYRLGEIK